MCQSEFFRGEVRIRCL